MAPQAIHPLTTQFAQALSNIEINGDKRERAVQAHEDIRGVLAKDDTLTAFGADPVLIGSYARQTGIYPGKDVDVFLRLRKLDTTYNPRTAYDAALKPLLAEYGAARITEQPRSIKVDFEPSGPGKSDGFSVDVVPAVPLNHEWALPVPEPENWKADGGAWVATNPEQLTKLAKDRNKEPKIGDQGAYKPAVKLVRQVRKHHLGDEKPGGLYLELLTFRVFERGAIRAATWAALLYETLDGLATLLRERHVLINPADDRVYQPAPTAAEHEIAASEFERLRDLAAAALDADKCMAARHWREILGTNDRGEVFPLPEGCTVDGRAIASVSAVAARGSRESHGFGDH